MRYCTPARTSGTCWPRKITATPLDAQQEPLQFVFLDRQVEAGLCVVGDGGPPARAGQDDAGRVELGLLLEHVVLERLGEALRDLQMGQRDFAGEATCVQ